MPEPCALLGMETSQRMQTVAVRTPDGTVLEESVITGDRSREDLVSAIDRVMRRAALGARDLRAVLLNAGPGGFTGLRVAHAAAQAMAVVTDAALVQVCAASCAHAASVLAGDLASDQDAWVALASKGDQSWIRCVGPSQAAPGASLEANAWTAGSVKRLICDEHLPESFRVRAEAAGMTTLPLRVSARAVLAAGLHMLERGLRTPPERLVPAYPREAEAVRLWRLRHPVRTDGTG